MNRQFESDLSEDWCISNEGRTMNSVEKRRWSYCCFAEAIFRGCTAQPDTPCDIYPRVNRGARLSSSVYAAAKTSRVGRGVRELAALV